MTKVWVGVFRLFRWTKVRKIFPTFHHGRFLHNVHEAAPAVWIPSAALYVLRLVRALWQQKKTSLVVLNTVPNAIISNQADKLCMHWIGHSTFLIQSGNLNILTDPIWGSATWLFQRSMSPRIAFDDLPPIHYVLISHNHRDHLDETTIRFIKQRNPDVIFLVPLGDKLWFDRRNFGRVHEFSWWQEHADQRGITFTFLPARHWSGRGLFDRNRSLWGSWMIQTPMKTVYFAGDTAYWRHFLCIRKYFPSIDVALLPIAPCKPWEHMRHVHLSAEMAIKAFVDLGARYFVPMHWGVFKFGLEGVNDAIVQLECVWRARQNALVNCVLQKQGELFLSSAS